MKYLTLVATVLVGSLSSLAFAGAVCSACKSHRQTVQLEKAIQKKQEIDPHLMNHAANVARTRTASKIAHLAIQYDSLEVLQTILQNGGSLQPSRTSSPTPAPTPININRKICWQ